MMKKHRHNVIPTVLHYWLTNLVRSRNQLSELATLLIKNNINVFKESTFILDKMVDELDMTHYWVFGCAHADITLTCSVVYLFFIRKMHYI